MGIRSDGNYTVLYDGDELPVNLSSQRYETREWTVIDGDVDEKLKAAKLVIDEKQKIESAASQETRNAMDAFNAIGTKLVDYKHT